MGNGGNEEKQPRRLSLWPASREESTVHLAAPLRALAATMRNPEDMLAAAVMTGAAPLGTGRARLRFP
jgi:hypothetical protein